MSNLIIRMPFRKSAGAEDGPSLELQFGTLANAIIADKYPKLDRMKLAFQLIDKEDDNNKAVGASVYLVGNTVIFIPAFYKNGNIDTGDMMFLPATQQFLPLSDPWLSWLQDKDLRQPGKIVDNKQITQQSAVTVKEITDPIVKTACVYLKGLLRTGLDAVKNPDSHNIFDTVLGMGKTASASMLDNLTGDRMFLNAALRFYSGDQLDAFAKKAAALDAVVEDVTVVLPFTKEAKELSPEDAALLKRDGYVIKRAAERGEAPTVTNVRAVRNLFTAVSKPGKANLLQLDGSTRPCLIMSKGRLSLYSDDCCAPIDPSDPGVRTYEMPTMDAYKFMTHGPAVAWCAHDKGLVAVVGDTGKPIDIPDGTIQVGTDNKDFKPEFIQDYGVAISPSSSFDIQYGSILCPDGTAYRVDGHVYKHNEGWCNPYGNTVKVSEDKELTSPVKVGNTLMLPQGSRWLDADSSEIADKSSFEFIEKQEIRNKNIPHFVTLNSLDAAIREYTKKHYMRVKLTSDGSEIYIDKDTPRSVKEAAYHLVKQFNIDPGVARRMLFESSNGAGGGRVRSETYLVSKTAAYEDTAWEDASVPRHEMQNRGEITELREMPTVLEDPAKLQQAIQVAAENGIKEVFDVTAFKLLIRQNRFLEEIYEDIPLFMRVLDSLCRKLFLLYWHTKEFENRYGTVKLESLEDSLKTTIDSLSDITIFFKLRNVTADPGIGNDGGDLMRGYDL